MARLFGTDGVRGQANLAPMDSETVMNLGRAAAHVLGGSQGLGRILIAKDTRISGYMIETALASGIVSMGVDVLICGPLPTPGVSYMTQGMRADAGVMISASHNPFQDNGIKFFGGDGFKLADETEDRIASLMEPGALDSKRADSGTIGKAYRIEDAVGRYTVYLKSCLPKSCTFEGLKLVVDSANGAAYRVAKNVFQELGAELIAVGDKPNGTNINDGCGSLHPELILKLVKEHNADAGIAFDGDADRVLMCDELGNLMDGDLLLAICAIDAKEQGLLKADAVVGTVMSNLGLEKALDSRGIGLYRSQVGDRYVLAEMLKRGANFGGEQSGHVIALDHNTTGDGMLTALLTLAKAVRLNQPLSTFSNFVEKYPQKLINIPVLEKKPFEEIEEIQKVMESAEQKLKGNGRILLRYSGTENKARVMVESDNDDICTSVADDVAEVVRQKLS